MTDLWLFIVEKAALSSARSVFSTQTGFLAVRARFSRGSPGTGSPEPPTNTVSRSVQVDLKLFKRG